MSSRSYPSYLFRDPLLHNSFLNNNREGTPITLTNNIDRNVEGDHLLHCYIDKLDEEVYKDMPEGLGDLGEAMWKVDKWRDLAPKMANESRKHGWCIVQFYDDDSPKRWEVFSVVQFTDYIKEIIKDNEGLDKIKDVGMKFEWGDYLGNSFKEEVKYEDKMTCLVKYEEGNGMSVFAFPDLSQAIMTLAFEFRQAKGQMLFSAAKPSFLHFVYGDNMNDTKADSLDTKIRGIDSSSAIGINKNMLEEIRTIENKNVSIMEPALDKQLQYFAGVTRLPISYYIGEKNQSSGITGGKGELTDMVKIRQKKEYIFNLYKPYIIKIFEDVYSIIIDDLELPQDATMENIEDEEENGQEN